ncbi:NBR1-Ig-like domain-containing protein [Chloroflexota bacterium]
MKYRIIIFTFVMILFLAGMAACTGRGPAETQPVGSPTAVVQAASSPTPLTGAATETVEEQPTTGAAEIEAPTATPDQDEPESTATAPTEPPSQPTATPVPTQPDCVDQAVYIKDVTIPDGQAFEPSVSFTKTWRVQNSGDCTWQGYSLAYVGGDLMNGPLSSPIPVVKPGESADISVELSAPTRFGLKTGYWLLQNIAGEQFGTGVPSTGQLWVQINVLTSSSGTDPTPPASGGSCAIQRNSTYESQILTLINQARASNGLGSVTLNSQLSAAALVHSTDMACSGFVDHYGSDGSSWYDRAAAQGYANSASAHENIYVGDPAFGGDAQGAFDWWMNSQLHRDNILNAQIREIGIAYVYLTGSEYGGYYTLVLAWP